MVFFKIVFTILGIIFTINLANIAIEFYITQKTVYACEEVTKDDPIKVQQICNKKWRRKE